MMTWTHSFLDRPAEYSVSNGRVLKGRVVIAYLHPAWGGKFRVATPNGRWIGDDVESPAQAMLMAIRDQEAPRC